MPDPTTNYGWDVPTVGGSSGAWGTLVNAVFDEVDADLKAVSDVADAAAAAATAAQTDADTALAELIAFPRVPAVTAITYRDANSNPAGDQFGTTVNQSGAAEGGTKLKFGDSVTGGAASGTAVIPLPGLTVGHRITGFRTYGDTGSSSQSVACRLIYDDGTGAITIVSSGHSLSTTLQANETTGLTHDVVSGAMYFVMLECSRSSGTGQASIYWVQPIVTRP